MGAVSDAAALGRPRRALLARRSGPASGGAARRAPAHLRGDGTLSDMGAPRRRCGGHPAVHRRDAGGGEAIVMALMSLVVAGLLQACQAAAPAPSPADRPAPRADAASMAA